MPVQEQVRLEAQQLNRFSKTVQADLFSGLGFEPIGIASFESERRKNIEKGRQRLPGLLSSGKEVTFGDTRVQLIEIPLVSKPDIKRLVNDHAEVPGLTGKQRVPKPENRIRLKRPYSSCQPS